MLLQIDSPCAGCSSLQVRFIETRQEASDNESYFCQLVNLYSQLTDRTSARDLMNLVCPCLHFVLLTEKTNLLASATLGIVRSAIRRKGFIEDLVVDQQYRGRGLGGRLVDQIIALAKRKGCQSLELTSRPERGTGCFLPKKGFEVIAFARPDHPEGTNLYRYTF